MALDNIATSEEMGAGSTPGPGGIDFGVGGGKFPNVIGANPRRASRGENRAKRQARRALEARVGLTRAELHHFENGSAIDPDDPKFDEIKALIDNGGLSPGVSKLWTDEDEDAAQDGTGPQQGEAPNYGIGNEAPSGVGGADTNSSDPGAGNVLNPDGSISHDTGAPFDPNPYGDFSLEDFLATYPNILNPNASEEQRGTAAPGGTGGGTGGTNIPGGTPPINGGGGGGQGIDFGAIAGEILGEGGILDRKDQNRQDARDLRAVAPKPFNMNMPGFGNTSFDGQNINIDPSQQMQEFIDASSGRATNILNDPNQNQFIDQSLQFGNENIQQAMEGAIDTQSFDPYRDQFTENQQNVSNNLQNNELLSQLDPQIQALFESGQWQNETGQGLIENSDFQFLADERLGLLRDQAQPYEQQQTNRLENSLASSGRSGGKGGAMDRGGLSLTQSTADIERQLQSQTMADQMREFNIGAGTNLLQGGSNALTGSGQVFGIGANADANKAVVGSNVNSATLTGQLDATGAENTRVRNILSDVQGMFGSGQNAQSNQTTNAQNAYDIFSSYMDDARKNVSTAANPYNYNPGSNAAGVISNGGSSGGGSGTSAQDIRAILKALGINI